MYARPNERITIIRVIQILVINEMPNERLTSRPKMIPITVFVNASIRDRLCILFQDQGRVEDFSKVTI